MPLIQESSTFTINGGNLTNIEGEQLIHVQSGGTLVQYIKHFGRKATPQDLDLKISNYLHVPLPVSSNNLHIQRSLLCDTSSNVLDQKYNAHRTVNHIACIEDGLEKDSSNTTEFLQVVYDGPDAFNAYQEDFERFSQSRDPQSVQLFGYNWDRDVPSLIFYEALIPVSYILEKHRYSPILRTYIEYMFGKAKMLPEHHGMLFSKLWINARTNTVHEGPYIHVRSSSKIDYYAYGFEPHSFPHHDSSVDRNLPISTYDETNILLGRLVKAIPTKFLLLAIRWSNRSTYECDLKPEDVVRALSCLPGTIYHMIRKDIVARWPGDMERWKYVFCAQTLRTTIPRKAAIMDGASEVRFAFTLSEAQNLGSGFDRFDVCYQLGHFDEWQAFGFAWTVQADNVFTQLGIEDRSGEYAFLDGFFLHFEREPSRVRTPMNPKGNNVLLPTGDTPIYLFIRPIPRPSDSKRKWRTWVSSPKYFWSFDSFGQEEISDDMQLSLGLALFKTSVQIDHNWWDRKAYDEMQMLHRFKGFDPRTMGFARSLGYPGFRVVDHEEVVADHVFDSDGLLESLSLNKGVKTPFQVRVEWLRMNRLVYPYYARRRTVARKERDID